MRNLPVQFHRQSSSSSQLHHHLVAATDSAWLPHHRSPRWARLCSLHPFYPRHSPMGPSPRLDPHIHLCLPPVQDCRTCPLACLRTVLVVKSSRTAGILARLCLNSGQTSLSSPRRKHKLRQGWARTRIPVTDGTSTGKRLYVLFMFITYARYDLLRLLNAYEVRCNLRCLFVH